MNKLAITLAAVTAAAFTSLIAAAPADAGYRHHHARHHVGRRAGPGYYEGLYEYRVDRNDRASSPYSGF